MAMNQDVDLPEIPRTIEAAGLDAAACLFRGLSDPNRLTILRHLALGEHRVVDLTAHLGLAQSTVSKHLACLRDCGLVESRAQGRASVFRLTQTDAVLDLLASTERLLGLTGDAASLCPRFEHPNTEHANTEHANNAERSNKTGQGER